MKAIAITRAAAEGHNIPFLNAIELPVPTAEGHDLLVEVKALLIFLAMIVFYFVAKTSGNFAVGSAVFGVLMLFIFRCKKPLYYAVVIAAAVAIWAVFRFGLGVLF